MTLRDSMTIAVTHELLSRVVTLLSSASHPLLPEQISTLVTSQIEHHPKFRYAVNNDLGLCVERLLSSCELNNVTDLDLQSQYATLRNDDTFVTEMMSQMATSISKHFTTPLYDLRVVLPQEANAFATEVTSRLPQTPEFKYTPDLQHFSWGKLGLNECRTSAMMFAQDRLNCFKNEVPHLYDTDKILRALPFGEGRSIPGEATIKPQLLAALIESNPGDANHTFVTNLVLSPAAYRKWALEAREALSSKQIGASVVTVTQQIDTIEQLLQTMNATMLTKIGADTSTVATNLLHNIETISSNIQLLRGAMLWYKDSAMADRLLLTPTVVQDSILTQFVATGGTEAMIHDYLAYVQLNEHITIPPTGLSADTIRTTHPHAEKTVKEKFARLQERAAAGRATALQNTLAHSLDQHNEMMLRQGKHSANFHADMHVHQRQRSLALLTQKPLEDIALEYLVTMRENPTTKTLFKAINGELLSAVKQNTTITNVEVATATCAAVVATLLDTLTSKFAKPIAA